MAADGVWDRPRDRGEAIRVLQELPALQVNLIDTADSYGPENIATASIKLNADGLSQLRHLQRSSR